MNTQELDELKWFEGIQARIGEAFRSDGFSQEQSEELGFCIAQAIRNVPALLQVLEEGNHCSADEILDAVHAVLANRFALQEAARILGIELGGPQAD